MKRLCAGVFLLLSILFLGLFSLLSPSFAVSSLGIDFSGKIVTGDGLDISNNLPGCINAVGVDTCPFQIKYYDHVSDTPGTLLGKENFLNVELGDYRGYFNLKLGNGTFISGTHSSLKDIFLNEADVYIEVLFDKNFDGTGSPDFEEANVNLERFVVSQPPSLQRMPVGGSPYSISTRGAVDEFQLKVNTSGTGTSAGLIYFDGAESLVRVHDGTLWQNLVYESMLDYLKELWSVSGDEIYFIGGNVGVGTNSPTSQFHVLGDSKLEGNLSNKLSEDNLPEVLGISAANFSGSSAFAVSGSYAFVGVNGTPARIDIYDISNPYSTALVNSVDLIYDNLNSSFEVINNIEIDTGKAYLLTENSLFVIDVSDVKDIQLFEMEESFLKFEQVSMGEDYNLALDENGHVWAWGENIEGQLGDPVVPVGAGEFRNYPSRVLKGAQPGTHTYLENIVDVRCGTANGIALDVYGNVWAWGKNSAYELGDNTLTRRTTPIQVLSGAQGAHTYLRDIERIYVGGQFTLAIDNVGAVYGWGVNASFFGAGDLSPRPTPVRIPGGAQGGTYLENVDTIAPAIVHTLVLDTSGNVYAAGSNLSGEVGDNSTTGRSNFVRVLGGAQGGTYLVNITDITVGSADTAVGTSGALDSSGNVWTWGYNAVGQLGNNSTDQSLVPVQVLSGEQGSHTYLNNITGLGSDGKGANGQHLIAFDSNNNVWTWGRNGRGQLGVYDFVDKRTPVRMKPGEQLDSHPDYLTNIVLTNILQVDTGPNNTIALDGDKNIWIWGGNGFGQLGLGDDYETSVRFPYPVRTAEISLGFNDLKANYAKIDLGVEFNKMSLQGASIYVTDKSATPSLRVFSSGGLNVDLSGSVALGNGTVKDLKVVGKYAYVLFEDTLVIVDVSDPSNPSIVNTETTLAFSTAKSFSVAGRYGYIVTGTNLYVIDLVNVSSLSDVSNLSLGISNASEVLVSGSTAFIVNSATPSIFLSVDVSNVTSLSLLGSISFSAGQNNGRNIEVQGKYGFVLTDGGIIVLDLKGIETSSILTNSFETFSGFVRNDFSIGSNLSVSGGMQVGRGGLYSSGDMSIEGHLRIIGGLGIGTGNAVYLNENGYLVASSSSLRYKNNVSSYGSVLSNLSNLELVRFTWNDLTLSSGKKDVGMIAEEVAKYIPELVIYNSFGQPEGLKYDKMGAYAIAGLAELNSEFQTFKESLDVDKPIYTSSEELELGTLVSKDFSVEDNGIKVFESTSSPLLGFISEVLESEIGSVMEEGQEELTYYNYHITPYTGYGNYEVLVSKPLDYEIGTIYVKGTPISLGLFGDLVLVDEEDVSSFVIGYLLEDLEFVEEESFKLVKSSISYTPLNFGFNSLALSSLFTTSSSYNGLTIGGNLVNFHGKVGSFLIVNTDLLNVNDRILIFVDEEEKPRIDVDGEDFVERVFELEKGISEFK